MNVKTEFQAAVIVFTLNAGPAFADYLKGIKAQDYRPMEVIVIDSGSSDGTIKRAREAGFKVVIQPKSDFNHGATRDRARKLTSADIIVMMTQDAIPTDASLISKLAAPLLAGKASFSYARQVPRDGAGIFEAFPRIFNYPEKSHIRGIGDVDTYGVYTFFTSDSCTAYLSSALEEIGGFSPTLVSEDYFAAARLLQKGHKVAYVADAVVVHSHSYSLLQEFRRYFDTGYVRAENPWVQEIVGHAEERGRLFLTSLVRAIIKTNPLLLPYALLSTLVKFAGYRIGYLSLKAPTFWKIRMSAQPYYWKSGFYNRDTGRLPAPGSR